MLAKKYDYKESEEKWLKYWEDQKINEFKIDQRKLYSIDTPPPTVSGSIHIGHVFSYSQAEMIARYKRLCGFNVYYPFGFDDNGYRVGYGKGFYDKLICDCNSNLLKIGFSFFAPVNIEDVNEFDKKLDFCITPDRIFQF